MTFLEKIFRAEANPKEVILRFLWMKIVLKRSSSPPSKYELPKGEQNIVGKDNNVSFHDEDKKFLELNIQGNGNTVIIGKLNSSNAGKLMLNMFCDNSTIIIGDELYIEKSCRIDVGLNHPFYGKINDVSINIGENIGIEEIYIRTANSHAKINIGKDCLISFGVVLYHTDSHPIFDLNNGKIINKVNELTIGEHCWLSANTTILKNSCVADDSIVGWGAVVSGKFSDKHCVIAGNPAKVVKREITWNRDGSQGYVQNEPEIDLIAK